MKKVLLKTLKLVGISFGIFLIAGSALLIKMFVVWGDSVPRAKNIPDILIHVDTRERIESVEDWESSNEMLIKFFAQNVYGDFPQIDTSTWTVEKEILDKEAYNGLGTLEQHTITDPEASIVLHLVLVLPHKKQEEIPLLLTSNFCGNHSAFLDFEVNKPSVPYSEFCDLEKMPWIAEVIFGDMINSFPVEELLKQGIAFGTFYPGEIVPDEASLASHYLSLLSQMSEVPVTGAVSAWAWGYSLVLDMLEQDYEFEDIVAYGHSRNAKATLWATVHDQRLDGVIAHQSGTGGATLNRSKQGESIRSVTKQYPHWFDSKFATYHGQEHKLLIDQHHLLALIAPRRILLGNARLDKWSDPKGAYLALREAGKVYDLYKKNSFNAQNLKDFRPADRLSYWFRPAPHGVRGSDWEAFLEFLGKQ